MRIRNWEKDGDMWVNQHTNREVMLSIGHYVGGYTLVRGWIAQGNQTTGQTIIAKAPTRGAIERVAFAYMKAHPDG